MRKYILTAATLIMMVMPAFSQTAPETLSVGEVSFVIEGANVSVRFGVTPGARLVPRGEAIAVTPVICKENTRRELPTIVVLGRGAQAVSDRHALAAGVDGFADAGLVVKGGESAMYVAVFPFEEWMPGADFRLEGAQAGCAELSKVEFGTLASDVLMNEGFDRVEIPVTGVKKVTTAEKLSREFAFITPMSQEVTQLANITAPVLDENEHSDLISYLTASRDNSLTIYFHQGESDIDHYYAENNASLVKLISAVRAIEQSPDNKVVRVVIAGFASPEGSREINERLGISRAMSVRDFLNEKSPVYGKMVTVYNGREDWSGLRLMVAQSNMAYREEVLRIIDTVPVWDGTRQVGRMSRLMALGGGEPYRYMYDNFFPKLRNAAYIKIFYDEK